MFKRPSIALLFAAMLMTGCKQIPMTHPSTFSHFTGITNFSGFARSENQRGENVLVSPEIKAPFAWSQLVVSWNADASAGTCLKVEARAIEPGHSTKYYKMGLWSPDNKVFLRTSVKNQNDADGNVKVDTLVLNHPANAVQIRLTLRGTNGQLPKLKFLGLSFCNTKVAPAQLPPNRKAWGKAISTPERKQRGYADASGWCSPASVSMALARWSDVLHRPELNLTVPEVANAVYDDAYAGTGNWPFNTAFAGSFKGMRAYVTRFDGIRELEDWVVAGIPVIISARWDLLEPGRPKDTAGHLTVCIGFTKDGDVIINDPATDPKTGKVRCIYKRENVIHAWSKSHNAVYLVYPVNARIPANRYGQW